MPTPEEAKRIFRQLFGRDPKGTEVADPSVAYQDSLAVSKERIAQSKGTAVDSARVFMGRKPEKTDKELTPAQLQKAEADSLRNYLSIMKSREEIDRAKTSGTFLKPDKPPKKGESPSDAQMRYIGMLDKLTKLHEASVPVVNEEGELVEGEYEYKFREGSAARKAIEDKMGMATDSLEFAEKAKGVGITDMSAFSDAVNELRGIAPEYLRIRFTKGEEAASKFLMDESGMSREQAEYFMTTLGYQEFSEPGIKLKGKPGP